MAIGGVYQHFGGDYQAGFLTTPHLLILSDRAIRRWEEEEQNISGPGACCQRKWDRP
jgi:hypothetical protein